MGAEAGAGAERNLKDLAADGEFQAVRLTFADQSYDEKSIKKKDLRRCRFSALGFKDARFEDCTFNHSSFERCFFRRADFLRVSFLGSTFRDCSFDEAMFSECKFDWAEFINCSIRHDQIAHCLPAYENTLAALARSLRVNAQARGNTDDSRRFLLAEIRASERHYYKMAFSVDDPWYRKKYSRWEDRLRGGITWFGLKASGFLWGHGERPLLVVRSGLLVVLLFGAVYWLMGLPLGAGAGRGSTTEYLLFSAATFCRAGFGSAAPATAAQRIAITAEVSTGLVFFGFFSASLYRWISKR